MEFDEISNDSIITNLSDDQNESNFLFDTEEFTYTPKIEELEPKIINVVSSINLGCNLNIKNLVLKFKNAEYNSSKSSTISLKSKNSKISATIFSGGKMVCTGAKSEKEAKSECMKFSKIVKKTGYNVELKDFKIQNIVASYDINFKISLFILYSKICNLINNSKIFGNNNNYCKYNKLIFPGLIFYEEQSKISFNIFESGKVVLSGGKKRKDIEDAFRNIYPLLLESKMTKY